MAVRVNQSRGGTRSGGLQDEELSQLLFENAPLRSIIPVRNNLHERRFSPDRELVGAPAYGPARPIGSLREVTDAQLQTVVARALRNYLGGSQVNLAADLASAAHVSLPQPVLSVETVGRLRGAQGGGSVIAVLQAADRRGVNYTLQYEVDVVRVDGRWEVAAVQMRPDA